MNIRHLIACIISSAVFWMAVPPGTARAQATEPRDGMLIHLSAGPEQPHRVLMALKMAQIMAEGGKAVLVYCDIEAVKLLVRGAPEVKHGAFDSSGDMLRKLAELQVSLRACPSCLAAAGKSAEDLLPGVKTADRAEFFSFATGRIVTLDY